MSVTEDVYDGNMGGLAGADAKCQSAANQASLPGTWQSILSSISASADSRLDLSGEIYNTKGERVAASESLLWASIPEHEHAIAYNQFGATPTGTGLTTTNVWTGSTYVGGSSSSECSNWSTNTSSGMAANFARTDTNWLEFQVTPCSAKLHLYCISDPQ